MIPRIESKRHKDTYKKVFSRIFLSFICFTLLLSLLPIISSEEVVTSDASTQCQLGEVYLDGKGCITPGFSVDTKIYSAPKDGTIASSLGQVQPIRVNNPYAVAGQPVIVEFTLENIGDQLGFPYDQITLPPDTYALQLGIDKDIRVVLPDGRVVDIWGMMTGIQKIGFLLKLSTAEAVSEIKTQIKGGNCGYVEITKYLPNDIEDKLKDLNSGKATKVYSWECINLVDMPLYETEVKSYCGNTIDNACITQLNTKVGNAVTDVVTVLLSSGSKSGLEKGECERPNSGSFWKSLGGALANKANVVECSIGTNGLAPGESVTFQFVALVPSDTPTISPQQLKELDDLKTTDGELYGGYTQSASCIDSSNPTACHSVYAGVYPAAQENLLSYLAGQTGSIIQGLKCGASWVWDLGKNDYGACVSTISAQGVKAIGEPLWEGQGVFYVLGPALSASITLILWGAFVSGALAPIVRKGGTAVITGA